WPEPEVPGCGLPALAAAKCVAKQSDELFERVHHALYEAFFTESRNIADANEVAAIVAAAGADMERFTADFEAGIGRDAVIGDYEADVSEHGVRSISMFIVPDSGRALVGLDDYAVYRAAVEEALA